MDSIPSPPNWRRRRVSTMQRSITSSILRRILADIVGSEAREFPAGDGIIRLPQSRTQLMRTSLKLGALLALVIGTVSSPGARSVAPVAGPALQSIGPMTFGPS